MMFPQATFLNAAGWAHLILFGVVLPVAVAWNARRLARRTLPLPARLAYFQSTAMELLVFGAASLTVARVQQLPLLSTGVPHLGRGLLAGVVAYAAAVLFMWPRWRRAVLRRARSVHFFMPANGTERAWWIVVSVLAGVGEELTWRGVQTALLVPLTGSYGVAAILSGVSFGVAHATQGWRSAAIIVAFALGFQAVVVASGSLYIAMAVHVAYDITAGLRYSTLGRQLGYTPDV